MSKPSFELYTAGYELNDDTYDLGEIVEQTLDYEEADLGAPRKPKNLLHLGLVGFHAEARTGRSCASARRACRSCATARSPSRCSRRHLRVGPAPVVVADKNRMQVVAGGQVHTELLARRSGARRSIRGSTRR